MNVAGIEINDIDLISNRVLDIGCGQGWALLEIARQDSNIFGLDLSLELLRKAREEAKKRNVKPRPMYVLASSNRAPFSAANFDLVICAEVIEHTLETKSTISEISRLLKPGGKCVFSFPVKYVENTISQFSRSFMGYSGHVKQFTLSEIKSLLSEYKLEVLQVHRKYFEWSIYWLFRALIAQIPSHDRSGNRYGIETTEDIKWKTFTYYYKRIWAKLVRWKIGIPLLWLGNLFFPKSYFLILKKMDV